MHHLTSDSVHGVRPEAPARPTEATGRAAPTRTEPQTAAPRIAAIIVTWNRRTDVDQVLAALARQEYPLERLNVVVVDNASSDGTSEFLIARWRPDLVVDNPTAAAHEPDFRVQHGSPDAVDGVPRRYAALHTEAPPRNTARFASLSLIRNTHNHGGCGGFNTGLAFLEQFLDSAPAPLDYAWMVDDDVDLPPTALKSLTRTAESDPSIGLVGSRTIDFDQRDTTTETTIYFDHQRGLMGPDPSPGHRMHDDHQRWSRQTGGTRGLLDFTGVRDVDVCSACSLLARWSAVKEVGFWDHRYFIYCDDADWCLRFGAAGYRVVCDLDAVVYHTYWLAKLTPARGYYSQRNLLWVLEKNLRGMHLKRVMLRRLLSLIKHSFKTMTHCRLFHAEILRRTAHDMVTGRGGRLDHEGPPTAPVMDALEHAGALKPDATVMVMCSHPDSIHWADDLRALVSHELIQRATPEAQPRWIYMVHRDVPDPQPAPGGSSAAGALPQRIVYESTRDSKWQTQRPFLRHPPEAVVVFDQCCEFPLLRSRTNIHIDRRRPDMAQPEPDGVKVRAAFCLRLARTGIMCLLYALTARQRTHAGKYG